MAAINASAESSKKMHRLKVLANSGSPNSPAMGYDVNVLVDDLPFSATKLTIVAEAGRTCVKAILEFGVSELDLEADVNPEFIFQNLPESMSNHSNRSGFENVTELSKRQVSKEKSL